MKPRFLARRVHKWLALIVGLQLLLWALSGFYMVAVHIDIIHGDMLVADRAPRLGGSPASALPFEAILERHPEAVAIELTRLLEQPVYRVRGAGGTRLIDASDARLLSPLSADTASEIARYHYAGEAGVSRVTLIEQDAPTEIQFHPLPLWRIDFDDAWGSSFYIDPASGRFVTRRHTLWRVFDFLWMLHIMDYDSRDDVNNALLRTVAPIATLMVLSGVWLLFYSFRPVRRRRPTA